jgi:hypothetical protein
LTIAVHKEFKTLNAVPHVLSAAALKFGTSLRHQLRYEPERSSDHIGFRVVAVQS